MLNICHSSESWNPEDYHAGFWIKSRMTKYVNSIALIYRMSYW